jgi:pimeloyl-ACP methyl ester carboxylesterase
MNDTITITTLIARTLTVEGEQARFAYRRFGARSDAPPLVLCMRLRGSLDHWDPAFLNALAAEREVIVFDNVGTGRTTGPIPDSLEQLADGAADFIAALGLTEVDLIGWSLGGLVAQGVALRHPGLVRRLVVAGSTPGGVPDAPTASPKVWEVASHEPNADEDFLYLFFPETPAAREAGLASLRRLDGRLAADDHVPVSAATFAGQMQAVARSQGFYDRLGELPMPVLFITGAHDIMIPPYGSYAGTERLADGKLIVYSDAGHGFLFQHPGAVTADMLAFLR